MSGQQIGYVIGYVIGSYFGPVGAAIGGAIGGYIGGVIDPTQINGPHIGDGQNQSSADGVPIPWILGTAPCVGNICDNGPRFEVKKTEGGKGDTTETNTFEAHQTFALLVCESCESRDSVITGVLMVRCNGKLVYDVRPGSDMLAESEKWKQNVTFYFGAEDQMPDPDLEAIHGIGNTPAYRGYFTAVFKNFNRSEFGDSIPQFEWVVVSEGTVLPGSEGFEPGSLSRFVNAAWPLLDDPTDYEYSGEWVNGLGAGISCPAKSSIAEVLEFYGAADHGSGGPGLGTPSIYIGYAGTSSGGQGSYISSTSTFSQTGTQPDVTDLESILLLYQFVSPTEWLPIAPNAGCLLIGTDWVGVGNGSVVHHVGSSRTSLDEQPVANCVSLGQGPGGLQAIYPVCVTAIRKRKAPVIDGHAIPDMPGWYVLTDGSVVSGFEEVAGTFKVLAPAHTSGVDPTKSYDQYEVGPILRDDDPNYSDAAFWTAAYDAAVLAGTMPAGLDYLGDYPVAIGSAWRQTTPDSLETGTLTLGTIVQRIIRRGGLVDADVDVSELTDQVIGYPIAAQYNAADCIRPLAGCYFFKGTEYDGQIHFHKDGADATLVVDPQDFINGEDEKDEGKRGQEVEYPRKLTGSYIDPTLDFAIGKSKAVRRSPDVLAIGEAELQIPVCMNPDPAAQATQKALKVMWAKQQGTRKFSLPYAVGDRNYLQMVPCMPFGLEGKRYVVDQMTINDGTIDLECSYDRQSAFTSNVTAIPTLPPTRPPSTIFGPTILAAMNLPPLRTSDTEPGLYFAVCGIRDNWPGCQILISYDQGETYKDGPRITLASVLGTLTDDVAAEGSNSEPILVTILNGELVSVTDLQLASGENGFAMVDSDDVWEVGRFQTQDELSPKHYSLTDVIRGDLLTIPVDHIAGQQFVMLANAVLWPIDVAFAGQTLFIKAVTFGTDPALTEVYEVVYTPDLDVIVDGGGD